MAEACEPPGELQEELEEELQQEIEDELQQELQEELQEELQQEMEEELQQVIEEEDLQEELQAEQDLQDQLEEAQLQQELQQALQEDLEEELGDIQAAACIPATSPRRPELSEEEKASLEAAINTFLNQPDSGPVTYEKRDKFLKNTLADTRQDREGHLLYIRDWLLNIAELEDRKKEFIERQIVAGAFLYDENIRFAEENRLRMEQCKKKWDAMNKVNEQVFYDEALAHDKRKYRRTGEVTELLAPILEKERQEAEEKERERMRQRQLERNYVRREELLRSVAGVRGPTYGSKFVPVLTARQERLMEKIIARENTLEEIINKQDKKLTRWDAVIQHAKDMDKVHGNIAVRIRQLRGAMYDIKNETDVLQREHDKEEARNKANLKKEKELSTEIQTFKTRVPELKKELEEVKTKYEELEKEFQTAFDLEQYNRKSLDYRINQTQRYANETHASIKKLRIKRRKMIEDIKFIKRKQAEHIVLARRAQKAAEEAARQAEEEAAQNEEEGACGP